MTTAQGVISIGDVLELLGRELRVARPPLAADRLPDELAYFDRVWLCQWVHLPNGWVVSVAFGTNAHCSNYGPDDPSLDLFTSPDCEIALFCPDGSWFTPHGAQTWPEVAADDLLVVVDAVATYQDGGLCPCPDCVRERRLTP
jgi:hypothetical protein